MHPENNECYYRAAGCCTLPVEVQFPSGQLGVQAGAFKCGMADKALEMLEFREFKDLESKGGGGVTASEEPEAV